MKRKLFIFFIGVVFLHACSESNNSTPIYFKDVVGCYNYNIRANNEYVCINKDSTYFHYINDEKGNTIFLEKGTLQYNRVINLNVLILLNFSHIDTTENYKIDAYFYVCKRWGEITIAHSFNADPDGTPSIPRYKKINNKNDFI
jgi:hypothetical protein